jgi:NitT/TauT family transport system ATP-binding protein
MLVKLHSVVSQASRSPLADSRADEPLVEFVGLEKCFPTRAGERVTALTDINLDIFRGEIVTIVGPSGCGKTTLLRILAGLEHQTAGSALVNGAPISKPDPNVAVVFQSATLLPWYTALENVLLPVRLQGKVADEHVHRAHALLRSVGLEQFAKKYPRELSGGMQQRVSICRALIRDAKVLLMDEPFGALDAMTRELMNLELMRIWSEDRKTILFITHSIPEAVLLGDRVVVMSPRPGQILSTIDVPLGRPRDLNALSSPQFASICGHIRSLFGSTSRQNGASL